VDDRRFGALIRATRLHRHWRQQDLATSAGVARATVVRIELGQLDELSLRTVRRVAHALEVGVELLPRSRGAALERVAGARHSALAEYVLRQIRSINGWVVRPEVSFSIWGERGVVDLLGWHAASQTIVVVELKTAIVDVGEILGTLDRKRRLGLKIAESQGWAATFISVALIVAEGTTNRRRVHDHVATFRAVLPDDGRRWRGWLQQPRGEVHVLSFVSDARPGNTRSGFSTVQRVQARSSARGLHQPRTNRSASQCSSGSKRPRAPSEPH
jgi:transcriptional regulator with XRE-family HTH domain